MVSSDVPGELGGGGILNDAGATLNLTSCAVINNQATAGASLDVFGGGLLNLGTAIVTFSTFTGNKAMGGGSSSTISFAEARAEASTILGALRSRWTTVRLSTIR